LRENFGHVEVRYDKNELVNVMGVKGEGNRNPR
jgi:hypothetical protein